MHEAEPGDARRVQHLIDEPHQPIAVLEHDAVELLALVGVEVPALERLEIQPYRREGRFQLVGDRVDERVVLLVPPHLADEEDRVEDEAR